MHVWHNSQSRIQGDTKKIPGLLMGGSPPLVFVPASSSGLTLPEFGSLDPNPARLQYPGGSSSLCQNQKIPPGRNLGYLS